jgi:hypothetical protein
MTTISSVVSPLKSAMTGHTFNEKLKAKKEQHIVTEDHFVGYTGFVIGKDCASCHRCSAISLRNSASIMWDENRFDEQLRVGEILTAEDEDNCFDSSNPRLVTWNSGVCALGSRDMAIVATAEDIGQLTRTARLLFVEPDLVYTAAGDTATYGPLAYVTECTW